MKRISIVVPCYNEEESIPLFYEALQKELQKVKAEAELWFVNDGSRDGSLSQIKKLREADARVHYLSFSRNFGKEAALYAGLEAATGDYVAVMDADLQDPPSLLPEMLLALEQGGADCVATRRVTRKGEPKLRSFFARRFYHLINRISKTEVVDGARDFRLMTRQMVDAILSLKEVSRFSKGIFGWVGFSTKWIEFENVERVAGETKWSFWKLLIYSLDGIIGFSTMPLAIASVTGVIFCIAALLLLLFFFIKTLVWGDPVTGFPMTICVILLLGGIQLFCIGILGQYLSKTYLETKRRPIYILKEKE
ncbi:MAG: glycosyltransferase family 2 protein [Bacillota bacterium]